MTLHVGARRQRVSGEHLAPAGSVVVVTATIRLSRDLNSRHDAEQRAGGQLGWPSPQILPLEAWIVRLWQGALYAGQVRCPDRLLQPAAERALWEDVVRTSAEGDELMEIARTAEVAHAAWDLACRWELPFDASEWSDTEDTEAFRRWAGDFELRCRRGSWLSRAKLAGLVSDWIVSGIVPVPREVIVAGFDELPPAYERLLASLRTRGVAVEVRDGWWGGPADPSAPAGVRIAFPDMTSEIRAAASWARRQLELADGSVEAGQGQDDRPCRVGVVVPELEKYRDRIEHIFRSEFIPGDDLDPSRDHHRGFNISLGPPLSDYPIVEAALEVLRMRRESIPLEHAGRVLRSPFLGGAHGEFTSRSLLYRALCRRREPRVSVGTILGLADDTSRPCYSPELAKVLRAWCAASDDVPTRLAPSAWPEVLTGLLLSVGWPGGRPLDSIEYQTVQAWRESLAALGGLDEVTGELPFSQALGRVERIVRSRQFQPESSPAPVQVLGLLEAGGLRFERLWIMGMDAESWPRSPVANPFLPLSLQRRHDMPDSSPERHLEFAERLTRRLLSSVAGEENRVSPGSPTIPGGKLSGPPLVVSHPCEAEGGPGPSPLFAELEEVGLADLRLAPSVSFVDRIRLSSGLETIWDDQAGRWSVSREPSVSGGTRVFADQAACPFRGFARARLGAADDVGAASDLDALDRGVLVHSVMERVWERLGSQGELLSLDGGRLRAIVEEAVSWAIESMAGRRSILRGPGFAEVERDRLETLATRWLEVEKQRAPFRVVQREVRAPFEMAGLSIEVRADRVDELADGSRVVVDYKTGLVSSSLWSGDRPAEPQLPVYAVHLQATGSEVAGVAFAVLRKGSEAFRGAAVSEGTLPGVSSRPDEPELSARIAGWQRVLDRLGDELREGEARVDPRDGPVTCRKCNLDSLCRIQDVAGLDTDADSGAFGERDR